MAGITDDAPQQASIGGCHPVVPIQVELGECRHINAKDSLRGNMGHQFRIHPVNPLDNNDMFRAERDGVALLALTGQKVVMGQGDCLTSHQG